jgi:uncharacterized protein YndB with AHSA1/START domain/predicted enzyme related to lactoylglutathione lyase
MTPANDPQLLQVKRLIRATPERVFTAWTTPEALKQWFGPDTCRIQSAEVDLQIGGAYRIEVFSEKVGEVMAVGGQYREITPHSKLVFTWKWEDDSDWDGIESVVTVDFVPTGGATEVLISHRGFPSAESRDNHEHGWNGCFVKLAARADAMNEMCGPGRFSWNELLVDDVDKAKAFYTELLGWKTEEMPGPMPYTLFTQQGLGVAGLMKKPMPDAPAQWLAYVSVESAEKSAQRVVELGGRVIKAPFEIPDVGSIAIVLDPEGVPFGLFQRV